VDDKLPRLFKPNEKFPSKKMTILKCMTTFEGYGSSWETFIAAMLKTSLKSLFMQEFSRLSWILADLLR